MKKNIILLIHLLSISYTALSADYFWVNNGGNWSDFSNHWATTSGGSTMQTSPPKIEDNVYFDAASFSIAGQTVIIDLSNAYCSDMDWTGVTGSPSLSGSIGGQLEITGLLAFEIGVTNNYMGAILFSTENNKSITSAGVSIVSNCIFDGIGTWNLIDGFTCDSSTQFISGTFITNDFTFQTESFDVTGYAPRSLDFGGSDIIITGSDNAWSAGNINFFFTPGTSTIRFTNVSNDTVQVISGGNTILYNNISIECSLIHFMDEMSGNEISTTLFPEILVASSNTQNWATFNLNGNCAGYVNVRSDTLGTAASIDVAGTITNNYLILQDVTGVTGTFTANNSIDNGNVINWAVNEPASSGYVYWIGNTGNWSVPSNWSTGCVPGPQDTIVFNAASFSGANDAVIVDINGYGYSMIWNGVTGNPILTGSGFSIFLRNSLTLDATMTSAFNGEIEFNGSIGTGIITSNAVVFNGDIKINGSATWQLADAFNSNSDLLLETGTFTTNNQDLTINRFNTDFINTRTFNMGSSIFNIMGDGEAFIVDATNLTINQGTSEVIMNTSSLSTAHFNGNNQTFYNLRLQNKSAIIGGGNTFNLVEINSGTSVILQNATVQSIDSLIADGTCNATISISAYSNSDTPPTITKTGYDTLIISYVNLNNVIATNTVPKYNLAQFSTLYNTTAGWDTTHVAMGSDFYWRGNTGDWSNINNWESPNGVAATCLPNITDTVYFDATSFSVANQICTVNIDAYCAKMDWTGSAAMTPIFNFERNLSIRQDAILNTGVSVTNDNDDATILFLPEGNNCIFETFEASIDVDVMLDASAVSDTLTLLGDLKIESTSELYVLEGTFDSNSDSITCGSFIIESTNGKEVLLNASSVQINTELNFDGTHTLSPGTSEIYVGYNNTYSLFYGGGKTYYNVRLNGDNSGVSDLTGTNTFNDWTLNAGIRLRIEASQTQNVIGNLTAIGTCTEDTIYLYSDLPTTATSINCATSPTLEVLNVTYVNATGASINALFSTNGGNSDFTFDASLPAIADFTSVYDNCLDNTTTFTNNSTAYAGGFGVLTFEWDFGDESTSTAASPTHTYTYDGTFYTELAATYTNGCTNTYNDSVRVNDAEVFFSTSESDSTICAGDSLTFYITSPGASNFNFLVDGVSLQNGIGTEYGTFALVDGNDVQVEVTLNTCVKTSTSIIINVDPLPVLTMTSSDADDIICAGDTVTFTASGADQYQFYLDGLAQGSYSNTNTFVVDDLTNGQIVTVEGKDTVTTCNDFSASAFTITVNPLPVPTFITSDADLIICQGDAVTFTASSSTDYEFFINGFSQQGPLTTATFSSTSLNNGDIVTVEGTSIGCTSTSTNSYTFFVNPIPVVASINTSIGNIACDIDNITFTATGASNYEFFVNGVTVFGPSGSTSYSTGALVTGDIVTIVGGLNGCLSASSPDTFTINTNPTVTLLSSDANDTICFEEAVTFTAAGATDYEFFIDGITSQGPGTLATYVTDSIVNGQTITVIGTTTGCDGSGTNNYQFKVNPPFIVNFYCSDIDRTICEGEAMAFTANGSGVTQYDLLIDGILNTSNASGSFSLSTLTAGTYIVSIEGTKDGCLILSDTTFSVLVNPIPNVTITSSDDDNIICDGDSIYFIGNGADNYEFFIGGFSQGGLSATDSILSTSTLDGQIISILGETSGCSANGASAITMTVNPVPISNISSSDIDNIICEGESITFTVGGSALYEFYNNGIVVQAQSATSTYSTSTINTGDIIAVSSYLNGCPGDQAGITVTVNPNPIVTSVISDADTSICQGTLISVVADGASTYEFFVDGATTGPASVNDTYTNSSLTNGQIITIEGTSNFGCLAISADIFTWQVYSTPFVIASSSDADGIICSSEAITFTASGADSINFYINGNWVLDGTSYVTDSILNGEEITINGYSNGCQTAATSSYSFTVYNYPIVGITSNIVNNELCTGDTAIVVGSGGLTYEFMLDGLSVQGPSAQDSLTIHNLTNGQVVYVNAINNGCASQSSGFTYTVNTTPVVSIVSSDPDSEICLGESVTFIASGATEYDFALDNISQTGVSTSISYTTTLIEDGEIVTVTGYNGICYAASTTNFIFVVNTMNIDVNSSANNVICNGDAVTITANGADEYEFFVDGISVQGQSAAATYSNGGLSDGQIITVEGTNFTTGCVQESFDSQLFVVLEVPVIVPSGPFTLCEGDSINLVSSYPTWNQWYSDATEISGENDENYYASTSGTFSVNISLGGQDEVWSVGENSLGQLGDSTWIASISALQTIDVVDIAQIDAGEYYTLALDNSGAICTWGENDFGQLGDGTFGTANYTNLITSNNFIQIAAGYQHALAILDDNTIMSWGKNLQGQLGLGNTSTTNFPTGISGVTGVVDISAGENHSLALLSNGEVMAWGDNQFGQLGNGTLTDKNAPILIGLTNIMDIDAGANHSMAIDSIGRLWVWGNNAQGQLGMSSITFSLSPALNGIEDVRLISGGTEHSLAVKNNNKLYTWGDNTFGQLGHGNNTSTSTPTLVSTISGVNYAEAGLYNTFAAKTDNSVWAFGKDDNAQLGDENTVDLNTPTHIISFSGATDFAPSLQHTSYLASFETACPSNDVVVTAQTATPVSIIDFDSLLVASQSGVSYQWYVNGLAIIDGTGNGQSIIVTSSGYYSVEVTYSNGCIVTSEDFPYNIVGIGEDNIFRLSFYPNPNTGNFFYNSDNLKDPVQLAIFDVYGKLIRDIILMPNHGTIEISLEVESGLYFYSIIKENILVLGGKLIIEK